MVACPGTEILAKYRVKALPEAERRGVGSHLAVCPKCRTRLEYVGPPGPQSSGSDSGGRVGGPPAPSSVCPPTTVLADFRADQLPQEDRRRLEAHVSSCRRCRARLEVVPPPGPLISDTDPWVRPASIDLDGDVLPERIGEYDIEKCLGKGSFGTVYLGRNRSFGWRRAIKVLKALSQGAETGAGDRAFNSFMKEAKVMDLLSHPNIARFYDGGKHGNHYFIVMEYVEGRTLSAVLSGGPLSPERVGGLVGSLCDVLGRAHSLSPVVVHRDLKPGNLMVTGDPALGTEQIKVLDFGVAKLVEQGADDEAQYSAVFSGTYPYASPEQFVNRKVDGRSDLYSVGVVLYELLTGRRPFVLRQGTMVDWHLAHKETPPPPFAGRNPEVRVPPAVEAVVMKCLEKDPAGRFQTASELADAYRAALASRPEPEPEPGPDGPGVSRRAAAVALAAALPTAALLWTAGSLFRRRQARAQDPVHLAVLDDVLGLTTDQRRYARYFRVGPPGAPRDAALLGGLREELFRAVGRLSRANDAPTLTPVGDAGLVYRIDLREAGWDARPFRADLPGGGEGPAAVNLFDLIFLEYPYGFVPEDSPVFERLDAEYLRVANPVRPVVAVRADWFLSLAVKYPLRDDLPGRTKATRGPFEDRPETLALVERHDAGLTFGAALAELGISGPSDDFRRFCGREGLGLGLGPLAAGGVAARADWDGAFPEVVRALGLGRPLPDIDGLSRPRREAGGLELSANATAFGPGERVSVTVRSRTDDGMAVELFASRYGVFRRIVLAPDVVGPRGASTAGASWDFEDSERITAFGRKRGGAAGVLLRAEDDETTDRVFHPIDPRDPASDGTSWEKRTLDITRK